LTHAATKESNPIPIHAGHCPRPSASAHIIETVAIAGDLPHAA
jgi:hypothetical protein